MYTFVQLLAFALAASSSVDAFQLGNNVGLARRATVCDVVPRTSS